MKLIAKVVNILNRFEHAESTLADLTTVHLPEIKAEIQKTNVSHMEMKAELSMLNGTVKQLLYVMLGFSNSANTQRARALSEGSD